MLLIWFRQYSSDVQALKENMARYNSSFQTASQKDFEKHFELSLPAGSSVALLQILLQKRDPRASGRTQTGLQVWQERERMEGVREVTISLI